MKIELNALAQQVARETLYMTALSRISEACEQERLDEVQRLAAQTIAVVNNRIDDMLGAVSDDDAVEFLDHVKALCLNTMRDEKARAQNRKRYREEQALHIAAIMQH